ncbi:hypothetical protein B0H10DRAFT_1962150 [Mycena sp. CBHHK59/15]|nr:hypothetical protein B0H10DRAFT_1962150 [Mycena sp. CBHHK59/15]
MPADLVNGGETASPKKKTQIPEDLFGLLPASSSMITLEPLDPKVVVNNEEALYKISAKYPCKIWEEHLVLKPMLKVDQYLNPNQPQPRTQETMEGVRDRCIVRGAILLSLADVFGDGLFASDTMASFLHWPSHMFSTKDRRLARAVEKDERGALQVLNSHLISTLVEIVHRGASVTKARLCTHYPMFVFSLVDRASPPSFNFVLVESMAVLPSVSSPPLLDDCSASPLHPVHTIYSIFLRFCIQFYLSWYPSSIFRADLALISFPACLMAVLSQSFVPPLGRRAMLVPSL